MADTRTKEMYMRNTLPQMAATGFFNSQKFYPPQVETIFFANFKAALIKKINLFYADYLLVYNITVCCIASSGAK
jgi:hypothetical protein